MTLSFNVFFCFLSLLWIESCLSFSLRTDALPTPWGTQGRVPSKRQRKREGVKARSLTRNTRGVEGHAGAPGLGLGRGTSYLVSQSYIQIQPTSWLEFILHTLGVGTSHGQPWTHLTHHGPDLGEETTFPHIIFSMPLHCTCIRMPLFPGTPKVESRNYPSLDSQDFGCS
jgi:hypothetical protein